MEKNLLEDAVANKNILDVVNKSINVANNSIDLVKKQQETEKKKKVTKKTVKKIVKKKPKKKVTKKKTTTDKTLKTKVKKLTTQVSKSKKSEELLKKEIKLLKEHIKSIKTTKPAVVSHAKVDNATLIESMNKLTSVIRQMISMFVQTNKQIQDNKDPLSKSLKNLEDQNEKIAQGILAVAELVKPNEEETPIEQPVMPQQRAQPRPQFQNVPQFPGMPPQSNAEGKMQFRAPKQEIHSFEAPPLIKPNIAPPPPSTEENKDEQ